MLSLSLQYPLDKALAVSAIGLITVIIVLAVIAVLILIVSKVIRAIEAAVSKKPSEENVPTASAQPMSEGTNQGEVDLIDTDEKTAAVIMAIVSQKSGIPLNRLSFKSIKLIDEEKKGEK